jgi:RNAse H-fold protein YqgF
LSKQANVVISLDFGTKKIGVCIAETYTGQSSPLPVLKNDDNLFNNLDDVINEWLPNFCIIGKPRKMKEDFKEAYRNFYKSFEDRYEINITEVNEDFTSQAVSKEKKKQDYDSYSATLIFEEWFNNKSA